MLDEVSPLVRAPPRAHNLREGRPGGRTRVLRLCAPAGLGPLCILLWQLDRDDPLIFEARDWAPDDRFRALVAARPGREQATASQLMFQQTGFARASRDLLEPGPREPDFEGLVRDADIAKRIRVIVTLRQLRPRLSQIDQTILPVVVDVPLKRPVGLLRGRIGRCRVERQVQTASSSSDSSKGRMP
jgi:hypothetical protein